MEETKTADPDCRTLTRQQIADYLGVSAARVSQLTREGVFSQGVDSQYDRHETTHAMCRWLRGQASEAKAGLGEIRRQKLETENQILGYALAREQRTMLPVASVEKAWEHVILLCRQKLSRIGNKVAPRIPYLRAENEIENAIQAEVDEATAELSRPIEYEEPATEAVKE